jgi:hypothetical protein
MKNKLLMTLRISRRKFFKRRKVNGKSITVAEISFRLAAGKTILCAKALAMMGV